MHYYEEKQVTETKMVEVKPPTCDCCGMEIARERGREIEVSNRLSYGDSGHCERYDVCGSCWEIEIVSLMANPPRRSEW